MLDQQQSEWETTKRDVYSSERTSPQKRMAKFADLLAAVDALWQHLTPEVRARRLKDDDDLNRRPEPWWKNFRPRHSRNIESCTKRNLKH